MLAQWIGDVIGEMHKNKITASELANEIGWHPKYLSAILNGIARLKMQNKQLNRHWQEF